MKRLFSVLFVVCAVCIFPKLSLAADEYISCQVFCRNCQDCNTTPTAYDSCMNYVLEVANCGDNGYTTCSVNDVTSEAEAAWYSQSYIDSTTIAVECNSSSGGDGGDTPGSSSNTCTVRFCYNEICDYNFPANYPSHTSGETLTTPSYADLGTNIQSDMILKGWSRGINGEGKDPLLPGNPYGISCNTSGAPVRYYPIWEECEEGKYADQVECKLCTAGHYCTGGKEIACPGGKYSLGGLVSSCSLVDANCYTTTTGSTSSCPNSCPANSSSDKGSDARADCKCNPGYGGNAGVENGSCTICSAGYYKSAGNGNCSPCTTGWYQNLPGQAGCLECDAEGYHTTNCAVQDDYKGCTACESCPAGYSCSTGLQYPCTNYYYSLAGMLNCISVSTGYYAKDCESGGKLCKGQTQCTEGHYCVDGKEKDVSAGYYTRGCWTNQNYDCVDNGGNCTGCTREEICPKGYYCTGGKKIAVPTGHYAIRCISGATLDGGNNCIGDDCQGCQWYAECPAGSYCQNGVKKACKAGSYSNSTGATTCTSCEAGKYQGDTGQTSCTDCAKGTYSTGGAEKCTRCTTGEYQENTGQSKCEKCTNGVVDDCLDAEGLKGCRQCDLCDVGYWCSGEASTKVWDGYYATGCSKGTLENGACVGDGCEGCTGQLPCPEGHFCKDGVKKKCSAGTYSTGGTATCTPCGGGKWSKAGAFECSPISAGCWGTDATSACPYKCSAGTYSPGGWATCMTCGDEYYLNGCEPDNTGCKECKKCPDGTTFAGSAVYGVENCGLKTCQDYYYEAKNVVVEGIADWEEWYESWSRCSSDGSSLAGCYMAPTMKNESSESMEVDGKGTNPKCCQTGTLKECHYDNGKESCFATCTGCTGGTAQDGACTDEQKELTDDSYTCPGTQKVGDSSSCTANGGQCVCPFNPNLTFCSEYLNNATNGGKVCHTTNEEKENYCEKVCYKSCDINCTQLCSGIRTKDGVRSCSDIEKTYEDAGRQYKDSSCVYYENNVPQEKAPNCSVNITCIENWYDPTPDGCKECSPGSHTSDYNTATTCTANTYYLKYNINGGTGGTMEDTTCIYGSSYTLSPNTFTRTGYSFAGWAKSANGNVEYSDKATVKDLTTVKNGTVNLYAKWTANNYSLKYDANGGTGDVMRSTTCIYDQDCTLSSNTYTRTGYTFAGWATSKTGNVEGATVKNLTTVNGQEVTLYAIWTANEFTVKFNINDGATGYADPQSKTCTYDQACTAATQGETMRKTDHVFKGWNTDKNGTGTSYAASVDIKNIISEGEITLYAIWEECTACDISSPGSKCELKVEGNECKYYTSCDDGYSANGGVGTPAPICKANEYSAIYSCGEGVVDPTQDPGPDTATFNAKYKVDKSYRGCSKKGSLFLGWQGTNNEDTIDTLYNVETEFTWKQVGDITFTAKWQSCPNGYYCEDGTVEKKACPVGSTTDEGAKEIIECYLAGGKSQICSNIDGAEKCFPLPTGVKVNYSGVSNWQNSGL